MAHVGLIGLGTMGANLALNIADNGYPIAVFNRTADRMHSFVAGAVELQDNLIGCETLEALIAATKPPRAIILMVPAGPAVDQQIETLRPLLSDGDVIIDAGNANFKDTRRRSKELASGSVGFIGMGVSGGSEGARYGPSIMVGGDPDLYSPHREMIEAIAAKYEGAPCAAHLGPDGAGHFVKTVHNGIEYADMQMIAEAYGLMRDGEGIEPSAIGERFAEWNQGPLQGYLTEITAEVLRATDPATKRPMVDVILDRAGQKGTGRWTLIEALELGQSATTIEAAVAARSWSADRDRRQTGAEILGSKTSVVALGQEDYEQALLAARIIAYTQGFSLLEAASQNYEWSLDHARIAEIWRAGCIIRSVLLDDIAAAFRAGAPHGTLALSATMASRLVDTVPALRRVTSAALRAGLPAPALTSALGYFDTLRQARGTTDLVQGQRDFFGAHGFERVDGGSDHHGPWR